MDNTKLRDEATRIVFKYLKHQELRDATLVCKSWLKHSENEIKSRGPMMHFRFIDNSSPDRDFYAVNKDIIKYCYTNPCIYLTYSNYESNEQSGNRCYCHLLPHGCYSIALKNNFLRDDENKLFCITVPMGSYCECLQDINDSLKVEEKQSSNSMKYKFERCLNSVDNTCCMIIFTSDLGYYQLVYETITFRFPSCMIPIWGGVVDAISFCKSNPQELECNKIANIVNIIIRGQDMKMWKFILRNLFNTKETINKNLVKFKKAVKLQTHSIGFIYTCIPDSIEFCKLQSEVLKENFPNVKFFHMHGNKTFAAVGFKGLLDNMMRSFISPPVQLTTIIILTYD